MSKHPMSPAELYAHQFQNPEPKFYTRVPNIIDHLTYSIEENGKIIKKRLSIYAKELYRIIRMIASDDGACWNSTESLAEKIGCSVGSVVNAKKELLMPMDQLDGSALVIETRKKLLKTKSDGSRFATVLCTRTIIDIWRWNNAFMATVKYHNQYGSTDSCGESVDGTDSCGESVSLGTDSCGEGNNIPCNNNPLYIKQHPTAEAASVCLSKDEKKKMSLSEAQRKSYEWMLLNGFDEKTSFSTALNFTPQQIEFSSKYIEDQQQKKKAKGLKVDNIWGYFIQVLKGRYWENEVNYNN